MEEALKIQSLVIYPIKSCRGISVPQATVTHTGKVPFFLYIIGMRKIPFISFLISRIVFCFCSIISYGFQ